jgi:hypothetical protein
MVNMLSREDPNIPSSHSEEVLEMFFKSKSPPVRPPAQETAPETIAGPASNGSPANGRVPTQPAASSRRRPDSDLGSAAFERDERRHQRAIVRERSIREPGAKTGDAQNRDAKTGYARKQGARTGERLNQARKQIEEPSRRTRLALGKTVSLGLIGIIVIGLIAGAILGAASTPGWIIGLLVATLTVILSAILHRVPPTR